MSNSGRLKGLPPTLPSRPAPIVEEEFISGAEGAPPATPTAAKKRASRHLPWEAPGVRHDVKKVFNLRLPEPYDLKLQHLAERTGISKHKFCLEAVMAAVDAKLKSLG